ncbi:hypothetical protein B484DRAFT_211123 [Ochromonadaceae sp. CCMP2298]|nr:hypothetical protein B484DRAFT_211123 [Ochromonadaceae sp. CCMP2298]
MDGHSPSGPPPGANTLGQEETQDSVTDTQPQGTDQTLAQIQSQSQTFPQTQGWAQPAATPSNRTPYSQSQSQSRGTTPFASAGRSSAAGTLPRGDMGGRLAYNPIPRHFNMNEPPTPGSPGPSAGASLAGGSGAGAGGAGMDIFSPSSRALRGPASVSSTWGAPPVSAGAGAALRGPQEDEIMLAHAQGLGMGDMGGMGGMDYDDLGTGLGLGANMELDEEQEAHLAETRIWGTDVNVAVCMNKFRNFLQVFTPAGETVQGGSYYQGLLAYMHRTGDMRLNLDCTHLKTFPSTRSFYQQLRQYPQELIPIMDRVVHEEYVL